jgi:hypothetical protein
VEVDGRAALVVGSPKAGKSTTTLSAALRGAGFVGDDVCAVDDVAHWTDGAPDVHALFASAKLWPDSERELGADAWDSMGRTYLDKPVMSVPASIRTVTRAPVAAVVVLRPPGPAVTGPTPIGPAEALRGLVPTARRTHIDERDLREWLPLASALAGRLPAYEVVLAWDLDAVADAVVRAIEDGARRGPQ